MARFKQIRDGRSNLTVVEVYGDVGNEEIKTILDWPPDVSPHSKTVFDFRFADLSALSSTHIRKAVGEIRLLSGPDCKAALVFSNPADYSIGKIISSAFSGRGYLANIRGFYNLHRAKDWLLF